MKRMTILICFLSFLTVSAAKGQEIYQWVDEKGTIHFTDDLTLIPERFRDQVQRKKTPRARPPGASSTACSTTGPRLASTNPGPGVHPRQRTCSWRPSLARPGRDAGHPRGYRARRARPGRPMNGPVAPGAPGIAPTWSSSDKDAIGTSHYSSRVWFTVGRGILNEVYWPHVDRPQVRDLGFIVADDAGFWSEVKRDADTRSGTRTGACRQSRPSTRIPATG